jgi:hypothetical protein
MHYHPRSHASVVHHDCAQLQHLCRCALTAVGCVHMCVAHELLDGCEHVCNTSLYMCMCAKTPMPHPTPARLPLRTGDFTGWLNRFADGAAATLAATQEAAQTVCLLLDPTPPSLYILSLTHVHTHASRNTHCKVTRPITHYRYLTSALSWGGCPESRWHSSVPLGRGCRHHHRSSSRAQSATAAAGAAAVTPLLPTWAIW